MNLSTLPDLSKNRSYLDRPGSFSQWMDRTLKSDSNDKTRSLLYFGFQPLFDALAEKRIKDKPTRTVALKVLRDVVKFSTDFVSGYYTGEEIPAIQKLEPLQPSVVVLDEADVEYVTKTRNIGVYDSSDGSALCMPKHIQGFLVGLHSAVSTAVLPPPDAIVGCACGSSEIVMAMSRIFDVPLDFIRRSKRRNDEVPLVIQEHVTRIKKRCAGKTVYVVEDFVCTGNSIYAVMERVSTYSASRVIGLSLARNDSDDLTSKLKVIHSFEGRHRSYAYEAKNR